MNKSFSLTIASWLIFSFAGMLAVGGEPDALRTISIPIIDLSTEMQRQTIVESIPGQYLGHPTTVLLRDNKTILVTYPLGHGGPAAVLKKSEDGGLTWSKRLPVPANWATATNCPCIHRLTGPDGVERLFVLEGIRVMRQSVSLDNGKTWTPFEPNGLHCVVAPITIVPIKGKRHLAVYQSGPDNGEGSPTSIWQSISSDGGLTWAPEQKVIELGDADVCEPAVVRSPDGKQLACLMRENKRQRNSMLMLSNDEGATWSKPVEMPASLTGDRHLPRYSKDGRLVIPFRDMAKNSPTYGDFVAWVGTYDDIVKGREGQYRLRLLNSPKKVDLGYPGLELLPDGTFVATTYAVLKKGEKNSVVSIRFKLAETDRMVAKSLAPSGDAVHREEIEWCNVWVTNADKDDLPRVLFIGDSITQQYFDGVETHLAGKANCARITTSTSIGSPDLLPEVELLLKRYRFKVIHVNNGMHGWAYSEAQYSQAFEPFMKAIMKQADGARLIWAHTTPVMTNGSAANERTERVKVRNQTAAAFAARHDIPVNDLFELVVEHPEYYSKDGVHLNQQGKDIQAKQVADYVLKSLAGGATRQ